jgi:peptidyl-tRNA hydrolase, PTH1 family
VISFEKMRCNLKIIIGLGNPEKEYKNTRHNIGFEVINKFALENNILINKAKFKAHVGQGTVLNEKIILLKPQTFMNLSGESVKLILNYYELTPNEIIVVYDDVNLEVGKIRIRNKGSAGGQNGMKDIIAKLSTDEFLRMKIGIGLKPSGYNLADFVLGKFTKNEIPIVSDSISVSSEALLYILKHGSLEAMNKFN